MNPTISSLKRAIKNYPHGMAGIAGDIGTSVKTLEKEMDSGDSHKLGVIDAVYMAKLMCEAGKPQCYDFAAHVAEECGGKFVLGDRSGEASRSPIEKISCLVRETSDVTTTVLDSMADGVISDNELAVIEREVAQAQDVLRKLLQASRAVNAKGKPGGGRSIVDLPVINQAAA